MPTSKHNNMTFSNEWLRNFQRRGKLHSFRSHGESGDGTDEAIAGCLPAIRSFLQNFERKDISFQSSVALRNTDVISDDPDEEIFYVESISYTGNQRCIVVSPHLLQYVNIVHEHASKFLLKMQIHVNSLQVEGCQQTVITSILVTRLIQFRSN